jgi:hypothetical protein
MAGILVHLSTKIFTVRYFTLLPSEDFMKFKLMPTPDPINAESRSFLLFSIMLCIIHLYTPFAR